MKNDAKRDLWIRFLAEATSKIAEAEDWHWFKSHFAYPTASLFIRSIVEAAVDCEGAVPGLGSTFIHELANIRGREKHGPDLDQLLQKLAELLILRQLVCLAWPDGTSFEHEPAAVPNGKRPELRVVTPDGALLFEVKTPSLLEHQASRSKNPFQVPGRALEKEFAQRLVGSKGLTLPRDNPVKDDFLKDANEKFAQFKANGPHTSVLVIVWDDFIYEPITVLTQQNCGLLTENSYFKDANGAAVKFQSIDSVVLIRHLMYFHRAAEGRPLVERAHAFDFGGNTDLPNVFIPISDPNGPPDLVKQGLRALPLRSPAVQSAADYRAQEFVMWL
jgi:hypothetical protein